MKIVPRVEERDGLVFEVPTWDPTPVEWNKSGSWAKDETITESVLMGLREELLRAGFDEQKLVKEALASKRTESDHTCQTYWGSHGCYRQRSHPGLCVCGVNGDECSAILKWGLDFTAILWWGSADSPNGLKLSSLGWKWFE
jgi:hypothetical protein